MPSNPFNQKDINVPKPKRSNFDLSFANHLSIGFGKIYPVFCEQCYPGDSFDIKAAFGLDAMPMVFPVQSSVRAHLHFFWVPNRILWKDWKDYYCNVDDSLVPPYIDFRYSSPSEEAFIKKFFSTGSLADYLNVPTTLAGSYGRGVLTSFEQFDGDGFVNFDYSTGSSSPTRSNRRLVDSLSSADPRDTNAFVPFYYYAEYDTPAPRRYISIPTALPTSLIPGVDIPNSQTLYSHIHPLSDGAPIGSYTHSYAQGFVSRIFSPEENTHIDPYINFYLDSVDLTTYTPLYVNIYTFHPTTRNGIASYSRYIGRYGNNFHFWKLDPTSIFYDDGASNALVSIDAHTGQISTNCIDRINALLSQGNYVRLVIYSAIGQSLTNPSKSGFPPVYISSPLGSSFGFTSNTDEVVDLSTEDIRKNPFINHGNGIPRPLSALPFRAYESICNVFYRNDKVDPFIVNGKPTYNKFVTTDGGGQDVTHYDFFYRNWEMDAYTGSMPSPQQGIAPLVGLTALGNMTIEDENGITTATATIDNQGTITDVVLTSPAASTSHARTAMNIAAAGMSINDFRSANSYQRFIEAALRQSYRYPDQIFAHNGIRPKYDEMDMPIFIGGVSQTINVSKVVNNNGDGDTPLGSFAGIASIMGKVNHNIRHYCDEHGFIMGLLCITPTPSYSQLLPKHFTYLNNPLDYFNPEFNNIGMQPITYDEVCPIQAYAEEISLQTPVLHRTFGYQRPWHEMVRRVDESHSLLRLDLRNYLINRIFNSRPELSQRFIKCLPEDCNDVFAVTLPNDDKFVGQVVFECYAKRPLPRMSIPTLE